MQGMTEADHARLECVKEYLQRYTLANENMKSLFELNQHISEDLSNPSIGGKGYGSPSGGGLSGGAAATAIKCDTMDAYCRSQANRNQTIKDEVTAAINLLEISRGKTIVEKRFIGGFAWRKIERDMNLTRNTCYGYYRTAMLILYDLMAQNGLI